MTRVELTSVLFMHGMLCGGARSAVCPLVAAEATALADPLEEHTADGELGRRVVRRPRLEPFVKFDLLQKKKKHAMRT
jgi:hypothetical protein